MFSHSAARVQRASARASARAWWRRTRKRLPTVVNARSPLKQPGNWQHQPMNKAFAASVVSKHPSLSGHDSASPGDTLTIMFDGSCPLCRREVATYRRLSPVDPEHRLAWRDVSAPDVQLPAGCSPAQAMARFHVQHADGTVDSGARAFIALWAMLPGWRRLARLASLPGIPTLLEQAYRLFLIGRPLLQRVARALEPEAIAVPAQLIADLRSDHAGETGAVWIYRGVLLVSRDAALCEFARRHLATEREHLVRICALLPRKKRSWLLPGWRVAGFFTGALPALFGARAVYSTIEAVETFVDRHYQHQIDRLAAYPEAGALREVLQQCQADEIHHRDEASAAVAGAPGVATRLWCRCVGTGSALAVQVARRL